MVEVVILRADGKKPRARKRPVGAPTHVATVRLRPTKSQEKLFESRFHANLRVYNACLAEALKRLNSLRSDPEFGELLKMSKGLGKTRASRELDKKHGLVEDDLLSFGSSLRRVHIREQAFSQETQAIARRAFRAVNDYRFGRKGRPRFKSARRGLRSIETKDLCGSIVVRLDDEHLTKIKWSNKTEIQVAPVPAGSGNNAILARAERERIEQMLEEGKALFFRIIRTQIRGRWTYKLQITMDGPPPIRTAVGAEKVSIDMGPSTVHVVHDSGAFHTQLAPSVKNQDRELRRFQRKLDRQHRAGSLKCFNENGTHKTNCAWKLRSKSAQRTGVAIADLHRKLAASRDIDHGRLANQILAIGPHMRAEKLNYTAWQKMFPHSVKNRAPGAFVDRLHRKAESAGGEFFDIDPWSTALSQHCVCGVKQKKPLSQRVHSCPECHIVADRDLLSAYLGAFVEPLDVENGETKHTLNLSEARKNLTSQRLQDIGVVPQGEVKTKQRVRRRRPSGRRSLVRIKARRCRKTRGFGPTDLLGTGCKEIPKARPTALKVSA